MTKTNYFIGAFALLTFIAAFSVSVTPKVNANPYNATAIGAATTTNAIAVTTSTRILASTTNPVGTPGFTSFTRVYATVCNPNANPVYLSLNGDNLASISKSTYVIAAAAGYSTCYEITDRNMYQGSVTASSTNQTSTTVTVSDYVQ